MGRARKLLRNMMFTNLGIYKRPLRVFYVRRTYPVYTQNGGAGSDIFYNTTSEGPPGPPGPAGPPGVSVVSANVLPNPGDLIMHLSDGTEINAGNVMGPMGPMGPAGPSGSCSLASVKLVKENYTALENDYYIGTLEKNITITLPESQIGKIYCVKNQVSGNIKLIGTNGQTIDSDAFKTLGTDTSVMVIFDGTRWNVI